MADRLRIQKFSYTIPLPVFSAPESTVPNKFTLHMPVDHSFVKLVVPDPTARQFDMYFMVPINGDAAKAKFIYLKENEVTEENIGECYGDFTLPIITTTIPSEIPFTTYFLCKIEDDNV